MTQDQEIRDAVEFLNRGEGDWTKPIQVLIDLAQRYLSCSSMMPSKKEVGEIRYGGCNPDEDRGYNEAIEACTLAVAKNFVLKEDYRAYEEMLQDIKDNYISKAKLMKKCEGIVADVIEPHIQRTLAIGFHSKEAKEYLSSAIQQYLTGSGR